MLTPDERSPISDQIQAYIKKLCSEQESLVARFINETGCLVSEVCLVEVRLPDKFVYYPDFKSKYEPKVCEIVEDQDADTR